MRDTNPVLRLGDMWGTDRDTVIVAKHSDIEFVLRNPSELFSSDFLPPEVTRMFPLIPENIDPPSLTSSTGASSTPSLGRRG